MSTHTFGLLFAAVLLGSVSAHADEARSSRKTRLSPTVEPVAPAQPPPPYELKKRSNFAAIGDSQRVPFWPIGWTKRRTGVVAELTAPVAAPKIVLDEKAFKVSSILLGNPSLAIVNGRTYMEGEFLKMPRAAGGTATVSTSVIPTNARVRVYRIGDGAVILQSQEQMIKVTLQRPELQQKTGREDLLQEDRP